MKSEELIQIWDNCSPGTVPGTPIESDETFITCLKGTVGETKNWSDKNNQAEWLSKNLSLSKCKTTVQQEKGSLTSYLVKCHPETSCRGMFLSGIWA